MTWFSVFTLPTYRWTPLKRCLMYSENMLVFQFYSIQLRSIQSLVDICVCMCVSVYRFIYNIQFIFLYKKWIYLSMILWLKKRVIILIERYCYRYLEVIGKISDLLRDNVNRRYYRNWSRLTTCSSDIYSPTETGLHCFGLRLIKYVFPLKQPVILTFKTTI